MGQTVWSARRLARKLARVAVGSGPAVEPQLREAPVMSEGSWVGLDVHARSVVAGVIDQASGEVRSLRVPAGSEATVAWLQSLPAPVRVGDEAGPTGYRLARAHDQWLRLRRQRFEAGPLAVVFDECYARMVDAKSRRDTLDKAIVELAGSDPYVEVVERLVCLRGVSTLTAFALTVELGDWR